MALWEHLLEEADPVYGDNFVFPLLHLQNPPEEVISCANFIGTFIAYSVVTVGYLP
jgi:hypothetical protein